jgi:hypothetical protein
MQPYRFNQFEADLLRRLTNNIFLKCKEFKINRYPLIYWGIRDNSIRSSKGLKSTDQNDDSDILDLVEYVPKNDFDIDLLGCYLYSVESEGYIEIYHDKIASCASRISLDLDIDYEETFDLLQTIVLLHEIGHWFSHCCFTQNLKHRMEFFLYQTKDNKETIAQLSVLWATLGLSNRRIKDLRKIMNHLTKNQSRPYTHYLKLGKQYTKKITILNRYVTLLDLGNCDLEFLLLRSNKPNPHRSY